MEDPIPKRPTGEDAPAIPFYLPKEKVTEVRKDRYVDYSIPLDPTATADSKNVVTGKILQWHGDGTPEEYIVWCQAMQELVAQKGAQTATQQGSIIMSALGGTAKKVSAHAGPPAMWMTWP